MAVCAVVSCKSLFLKGSRRLFHLSHDPAVRVMCVEDCKRADNFDPANARICSEHFQEYDESFAVPQALS